MIYIYKFDNTSKYYAFNQIQKNNCFLQGLLLCANNLQKLIKLINERLSRQNICLMQYNNKTKSYKKIILQ